METFFLEWAMLFIYAALPDEHHHYLWQTDTCTWQKLYTAVAKLTKFSVSVNGNEEILMPKFDDIVNEIMIYAYENSLKIGVSLIKWEFHLSFKDGMLLSRLSAIWLRVKIISCHTMPSFSYAIHNVSTGLLVLYSIRSNNFLHL